MQLNCINYEWILQQQLEKKELLKINTRMIHNAQSIFPEAQNQIFRNEQSMCEKISSSIKKTNKISIYSKKTTKSPKKNEPPSITRNFEPQAFNPLAMTTQRYAKGQPSQNNQIFHHQKLYQKQNPVFNMQISDKNNVFRQQSYQQKVEENTLETNFVQIKKSNTLNDGQISSLNQKAGNFKTNVHNISQMIDKQAESQINNQSFFQNSFFTGNRAEKQKISLSQTSNVTDNQRYVMQNFMQCMNQQIYIAKQNYQKKFNQLLRDNARLIKQLQQKLRKNQISLKQKNQQIQKLQFTLKLAPKKVVSQGSINPSQNQIYKAKYNNFNGYDFKRVSDLEAKLAILQNYALKSQQTSKAQKRMQVLQKGILCFFNSHLKAIKDQSEYFIRRYSDKFIQLNQSCQKLGVNFQKVRAQFQKNNGNQNKIKQIQQKLKETQSQVKAFIGKQFKYQNVLIYELQDQLKKYKQDLRNMENHQFQNSKLIKALNKQFIKFKNESNILNAHEAVSNYTHTNPNFSKLSIDQVSNIHQYSHLLQKLNPKNQNFSKNDDSSIISMNFTEEASQRVDQIEAKTSNERQQTYQYAFMSKYTKTTDMKQTNCQIQNSPPTSKPYYLPNHKITFSIHQNNENSTRQKIKSLNDLKMESKETNKTPMKIASHNLHDKNNNSYWSISQMEDFNASRELANQTNQFSDDEFFYPGDPDENSPDFQQEFYKNQKSSPEKNSSNSKQLYMQEISPMQKKKFVLTQQNFYKNSLSYHQTIGQGNKKKSEIKSNFMYNSSFEYQNFSEEDQDKQAKNAVQNLTKMSQPPLKKKTQSYSKNQLALIQKCNNINTLQFPLKIIYDRKKGQGVMKMVSSTHPLNGKTFFLQPKQVQRLEFQGLIQVKTYI